jgi:hypothetical protein
MTLIERIEHWKPGTPSRELDDEILLACGWNYEVDEQDPNVYRAWWTSPNGHGSYYDGDQPSPLTSLDAGRDLTDWLILDAGDIQADGLALVRLGDGGRNGEPQEVVGIASTLKAAMVIAALKSKGVK